MYFHYDLRGDSLGALSMWQRGLLNLIYFEREIHRDCLLLWSSDVFFFLDTSESDILVASRCIWNVWFLEHTSEMPPFRAFPMYCYSSFSRRYIGIEIQMPIPMYGGPNLSIKYIGMG